MCALGDLVVPEPGDSVSPTFLSVWPICVAHLPVSDSASVEWQTYRYYGMPAGFVNSEKLKCFPVPANKQQVDATLTAIQGGCVPLIGVKIVDEKGEHCYCCGGVEGLKKCSAVYCSADCQKKSWKFHKPVCTAFR
eukprot:GDKI01037832.1.p1 GENE.GDKI01037832.1~~GDKI01037832.1.p1  ORF type:complete len:136 (-),score=42.16 GDKI01037832.1:222-629(-)